MRPLEQQSVFVFALVLLSLGPAQGQYTNLLSAVFGGTTPSTTPSSPTVISTATPSPTPAATPATPTTPATPSSTSSSTDSTTPSTPASTVADTSATPVAVASPAIAAAPATTASPAAAPVITPLPRRTPSPTKKAPSPPPPAPIIIDPAKLVAALPSDQIISAPAVAPATGDSDQQNADITAVDAVLKVSGPGVTPFVIPQQTVLLRALASVLTTASLRDLRIRYVTSSADSRRRLLHATAGNTAHRALLASSPSASDAAANGQLYNVASVTVEVNCSSSSAVPATLAEMQSVVDKDLLSSAIQSYGQPQWGVSLLSLTSVNPAVALATSGACRKNFGHFCLDHTSLSVAAVEVIIAIGAVVVVMVLAIPCVLLEWRRKSGQMAELDPVPQTPKTPLDHVQHMYNKFIGTVKAVSPMHRRGGSKDRSAFSNESPHRTPTGEKDAGSAVHMTAYAP